MAFIFKCNEVFPGMYVRTVHLCNVHRKDCSNWKQLWIGRNINYSGSRIVNNHSPINNKMSKILYNSNRLGRLILNKSSRMQSVFSGYKNTRSRKVMAISPLVITSAPRGEGRELAVNRETHEHTCGQTDKLICRSCRTPENEPYWAESQFSCLFLFILPGKDTLAASTRQLTSALARA